MAVRQARPSPLGEHHAPAGSGIQTFKIAEEVGFVRHAPFPRLRPTDQWCVDHRSHVADEAL